MDQILRHSFFRDTLPISPLIPLHDLSLSSSPSTQLNSSSTGVVVQLAGKDPKLPAPLGASPLPKTTISRLSSNDLPLSFGTSRRLPLTPQPTTPPTPVSPRIAPSITVSSLPKGSAVGRVRSSKNLKGASSIEKENQSPATTTTGMNHRVPLNRLGSLAARETVSLARPTYASTRLSQLTQPSMSTPKQTSARLLETLGAPSDLRKALRSPVPTTAARSTFVSSERTRTRTFTQSFLSSPTTKVDSKDSNVVPLSTLGLASRLHNTEHGTVEILNECRGLVLDLRKSERKSGKKGDEVLRISADGGMVSHQMSLSEPLIDGSRPSP